MCANIQEVDERHEFLPHFADRRKGGHSRGRGRDAGRDRERRNCVFCCLRRRDSDAIAGGETIGSRVESLRVRRSGAKGGFSPLRRDYVQLGGRVVDRPVRVGVVPGTVQGIPVDKKGRSSARSARRSPIVRSHSIMSAAMDIKQQAGARGSVDRGLSLSVSSAEGSAPNGKSSRDPSPAPPKKDFEYRVVTPSSFEAENHYCMPVSPTIFLSYSLVRVALFFAALSGCPGQRPTSRLPRLAPALSLRNCMDDSIEIALTRTQTHGCSPRKST